MKASAILTAGAILLAALPTAARTYTVTSPDGHITVNIDAGKRLTWSVSHDGTQAVAPSPISLTLTDGRILGDNPRIKRTRRSSVDTRFATPLYRKAGVDDRYNQIAIDMRGGYTLQIRAYDDAAAYRFVLAMTDSVDIASEQATFTFGAGRKAWLPLVNDLRDPSYPYSFSFESYYDEMPLGSMPADTLSITPVLIDLDGHKKALVMEGMLEDYPGMMLRRSDDGAALLGVHAPQPSADRIGGFNRLNLIPTATHGRIARVSGHAALPWRAMAVTAHDSALADLDLAMRLGEPSRIADTSWIHPGKVAWDWWNDWGLTGVGFEAGINTPTYLHYIDFAARKGLEYVILDEGWSGDGGILDISPAIDLQKILAHAAKKGVGIILWAAWRDLRNCMDQVLPHYAAMGVKGFKVDFFDRDDQVAVQSVVRLAQTAADNRLLLDLHGFRPVGLHRTYPNIVNYEGVKGLENYKWGFFGKPGQPDQLRYDVTIPFIRMAAGPLDYTPGAMTNSTAASYRPSNDAPMSLGTRAHQVAMYIVYDGALQMLADSPTAYDREPACTDFMAALPTVFDETRVLSGHVGEHIAIARRKGDTWYIAAMTDAAPRTLSLATPFLTPGMVYSATALTDGVNAVKHPTDYSIIHSTIAGGDSINVTLAPGGGYTAVLRPSGH